LPEPWLPPPHHVGTHSSSSTPPRHQATSTVVRRSLTLLYCHRSKASLPPRQRMAKPPRRHLLLSPAIEPLVSVAGKLRCYRSSPTHPGRVHQWQSLPDVCGHGQQAALTLAAAGYSRPVAGRSHPKACHSSPSPLRSSLEPVDAILGVNKTLASYSLLHTRHLYTSPFIYTCCMIS
jgi:hypothetical protein